MIDLGLHASNIKTMGWLKLLVLFYQFYHVFQQHQSILYEASVGILVACIKIRLNFYQKFIYSSLFKAVRDGRAIEKVKGYKIFVQSMNDFTVLAFFKDSP
jgi:hypothetical protein